MIGCVVHGGEQINYSCNSYIFFEKNFDLRRLQLYSFDADHFDNALTICEMT